MRVIRQAFDGGGAGPELPKIAKKDKSGLLPKPTIVPKPGGKAGLPTVKFRPAAAKLGSGASTTEVQPPTLQVGNALANLKGEAGEGPSSKRQRVEEQHQAAGTQNGTLTKVFGSSEQQGEGAAVAATGDGKPIGLDFTGQYLDGQGEDSEGIGGGDGHALLGLLGAYGGDDSGSDGEQDL